MSRLFFRDRRACVEYFSNLGLLIAPQVVKVVFTAQERGFQVVDHFPSGALQTGYLTPQDIVMVPVSGPAGGMHISSNRGGSECSQKGLRILLEVYEEV